MMMFTPILDILSLKMSYIKKQIKLKVATLYHNINLLYILIILLSL